MSTVRASDRVRRVLTGERISDDELADMLRLAAKTKIRGFTRRYFHWLFRVDGDRLEDMQYADLVQVGKGVSPMTEEHEPCMGLGCRGCGWSGQVVRWITDKPLPQRESLPQYLHRRAS